MVNAKLDAHTERIYDFYVLMISICDPFKKKYLLCHEIKLIHYIIEKLLGAPNEYLL